MKWIIYIYIYIYTHTHTHTHTHTIVIIQTFGAACVYSHIRYGTGAEIWKVLCEIQAFSRISSKHLQRHIDPLLSHFNNDSA